MTFTAAPAAPIPHERNSTRMPMLNTGPTTFSSFLSDHRRGRLANEVGEKLAELTAEVIEKGKTGELVIKLKVTRTGEDQVDIADDVTMKLPKGERGKAVWFADEHGTLSRQPPRQTTVEDEIEARRAEREGASA